jgi:hypothetical protein
VKSNFLAGASRFENQVLLCVRFLCLLFLLATVVHALAALGILTLLSAKTCVNVIRTRILILIL